MYYFNISLLIRFSTNFTFVFPLKLPLSGFTFALMQISSLIAKVYLLFITPWISYFVSRVKAAVRTAVYYPMSHTIGSETNVSVITG